MKYNSENKTIILPLYIILFFILIIFICVFNFYSLASSKETTNQIKTNEISNNIINNNTTTNETIKKEKEYITEENNVNTNVILNNHETQNQNSNKTQNEKIEKNQKTAKYTTKNGKTYETIGILEISSLDIKYPILSETTDELLKISLTKYWGGNPHEIGNLCILGHNYKNDNSFFGNLPNIENNDIIKLTDINQKTLNYKVYDTFIIDPDDTSCTSQLTDGNIDITLITCYYEKGLSYATKRFVVKARAL